MASLNKVFLMGNLTRDPEIRYTTSGSPVANFGMAVNRVYTDQSGEKKEDTCFVRVVVFGKQAETCGKYLSKGRLILLEGRLQYRSWESDGKKRSSMDVIGERIQFLSTRKQQDTEGKTASEDEEIFLDDDKDFDKDSDNEVPF
jgi:single-strand DNA-binding protein